MCFRSWAGGNGAGAVPLSQIYEQISGEPAANYYSFAIIILTIANLFCILAGALLNRLGKKVPSLTGDGTNIMPVDSKLIKEDVEIKVSLTDYSGTLLLMGAVYAVGRLFSKVLLPTVFGAQIPYFCLQHHLRCCSGSAWHCSGKHPCGSQKYAVLYGIRCSTDDYGWPWI